MFEIGYRYRQHGQSIVEIVVVLGIAAITFASIGSLIVGSLTSVSQEAERQQAISYAQEGLEAVRSLRDADFDNLTTGTHGLAIASNQWTLSGSSDASGIMTRVITISDVSLGDIESVDIKQVESAVTWKGTSSTAATTLSYTEYFTDWNQTDGDAEDLSLDISNVQIGVGAGNKQLEDIELLNTGTGTITLDKITAWWDNAYLLRQIRLDTTNVFGPVPAASGVASGTEIDITNVSMASGSSAVNTTFFKYTGDITGTNFIIEYLFSDGSTKYAYIQEPGVGPSGGNALDLVIDSSAATIDAGDTSLVTGITLENTGVSSIIIDTIIATWTGGTSGSKIKEMTIDGASVWTGTGNSGQEQDISDVTLTAGTGSIPFDSLDFSKDMTGVTLDLTFTMGDGSTNTITGITP
jgi:type II secretory pathway pseudopilin PulG